MWHSLQITPFYWLDASYSKGGGSTRLWIPRSGDYRTHFRSCLPYSPTLRQRAWASGYFCHFAVNGSSWALTNFPFYLNMLSLPLFLLLELSYKIIGIPFLGLLSLSANEKWSEGRSALMIPFLPSHTLGFIVHNFWPGQARFGHVYLSLFSICQDWK